MTNPEKVFPNKTQTDDHDFKGKCLHSLVPADGKIISYVYV